MITDILCTFCGNRFGNIRFPNHLSEQLSNSIIYLECESCEEKRE